MSHRIDEKQARREARLAAEAEAKRVEQRNRLIRRGTYAAVAVIAATLVAMAAALGGSDKRAVKFHESGGEGASVGATAPSFTLTDVVSGRTVTSKSLRGRRTMLFFSEGVNCQACMIQATDLEKQGTLRKAGIALVSVTTDRPSELATAARQYGIRLPLLADPTTEMSSAYGMLGHGGMGHPTTDGHAFMLLSASGKVLWHRAYQEMYVKPSQLIHDMRAAVRA